MVKYDKNIIFGSIVLFIIAIALFNIVSTQFQAYGSGFSLQSISKIALIDATTNTYEFLITGSIGGSELPVFTLNPNLFKSQTGLETTNAFSMSVKNNEEQIIAAVNKVRDIYELEYELKQNFAGIGTPSLCNSDKLLFKQYVQVRGLTQARHCVYQKNIGKWGEISKPITLFSADITITNGVFTDTKTISSSHPSVDFFYNGKRFATVIAQGGLVTGTPPSLFIDKLTPSGNLRTILLAQENNVWQLVRLNAITSFDSLELDVRQAVPLTEDEETSFFRKYFGSLQDPTVQQVQNIISNEVNNFNINSKDVIKKDILVLPEGSSFQDNKDSTVLRVTPDNYKVLNQQIKINLIAETVAVKRMNGIPAINKISCPTFSSGTVGKIGIDIENKAVDSGGSFEISTSCNNLIVAQGITKLEFIPNEKRTVSVLVTQAGSNQALTDSCMITVTDEGSRKSVSKSVSCTTTKELTCTPGERTTNLDFTCVETCNSAGTGYDSSKQECCEFGVTTDGSLQCKGKPVIKPVVCNWYDLDCIYKNRTKQCSAFDIACHWNTFLTPLRNMALFFFPIITFLLFTTYLREEKLLRKQQDLLIAGLAAGIAMLFLVWQYFDIAVVVIIFFYVIKLLLRSVKPI